MNSTNTLLQRTLNTAASNRPIGAILVGSGRLSPENADKILSLQKQHGKRFGDAAIELGLLDENDVRFALASQFNYSCLEINDNSLNRELIAAYDPFNPVIEQLRALRSQLILRWFNGEPKQRSLAVVSPGRREGRSFIAANLAVVFSQLGERTLLIDADLRSPRQHELFKLGRGTGLSEILCGRVDKIDAAVKRITALQGLWVLPSGATPPNPQELLGRPVFSELVESLGRDFDAVIIDTPAACEFADALSVAVRVGGAFMIARKDLSSLLEMTHLTRQLQQSGATLLGSVLNDA